jgi:Zn-dependent protease with chaperone function
MLLSYWFRLFCLMLFSVGVMQVALYLLLRLVMPVADRGISRMTARCQERIYFAIPVASHVVALLLAMSVVGPQYIRNETNRLQEHVGIVCMAGATIIAARYLYALLRAALLILQMHRAHKHDEAPVVLTGGTPVYTSVDMHPLLAVTGVFSPRIVISRHLLNNAEFSSESLEIALAHETAHLCQHDNLKHLVLASLTLFNAGARQERSLQRWRHAAEIAADDDAVSGNFSRAILLAETLLVAARTVPSQRMSVLSLGLLPHEEELDKRIDRLLRNDSTLAPTTTPSWRHIIGGGIFLLAGTCTLLHLFAASFHEAAEYVLHLG